MKHLTGLFPSMKINFTEEALQNLYEIAEFIYEETCSKSITAKNIRELKAFTEKHKDYSIKNTANYSNSNMHSTAGAVERVIGIFIKRSVKNTLII